MMYVEICFFLRFVLIQCQNGGSSVKATFLFIRTNTWKKRVSQHIKYDISPQIIVDLYLMCSNSELRIETSPFLAMRPATVNWMESLAAPLPLFFHCSSLSLRIFILSANDIFGPTSTLPFYQEKAGPQSVKRLNEEIDVYFQRWWKATIQTTRQEFITLWLLRNGGLISSFYTII